MVLIHAELSTLDGDIKYFPTTMLKFVLMSICTLGIYHFFWSFKNWCYIKDRDQSAISPFLRSLFLPIWFYFLLADISDKTTNGILASHLLRVFLAFALFMLSALWRLSDPYWLLSLLTFVPILPAVAAIKEINSPSANQPSSISPHRPANYVTYLLGGAFVAFLVMSTTGYLPGSLVREGESLWNRDLTFLRENKILGPEEEIIYFFSMGVFSIREDGQFISEDYVTSYQVNPSDGLLYVTYAAYDEIQDIQANWAASWADFTVVTITMNSGDTFDLWLSQESGGDRKFVSELKRLRSARLSIRPAERNQN